NTLRCFIDMWASTVVRHDAGWNESREDGVRCMYTPHGRRWPRVDGRTMPQRSPGAAWLLPLARCMACAAAPDRARRTQNLYCRVKLTRLRASPAPASRRNSPGFAYATAALADQPGAAATSTPSDTIVATWRARL